MERQRNPGSAFPPAEALAPDGGTAKQRSLHPGYRASPRRRYENML